MKPAFSHFVLITIIATLAWFSYAPGLTGGFMFDDENNLNDLAIIKNELSFENLKTYFGESTSGPLKRPISVFSFLIDAQNWPAEPYSFKRTNVIIHIFNGALLYLVLLLLFKFKGFENKNILFIAGFISCFWLLHPFLVSTTLYVVQRMAMLPLTFMLLGLTLYLIGRKKYQYSEGMKGHYWLFCAVYLMTLLAMLSKENGIVFIWLVALFEALIIKGYLNYQRLSGRMSLWLLKLPVMAAILLLLIQIPTFVADYNLREYDMYQRLLSQSRAVLIYLYHWFVPDYFTEGVYTDGFKQSENIFNPISTFFSVMVVVSLISLAWIKRKRWVWFSFVLFFFLISQVLESTIVPLELYFEHRVYVGSVFLSVPVALFFNNMIEKSKIYLTVPFLVILVLSGMTYLRSNVWSNNLQLHKLTSDKFPESLRARIGLANIYDSMGLMDDLERVVKDGFKYHDNLELTFNLYAIKCFKGELVNDDISVVVKKLRNQKFVKKDYRTFLNLTTLMFKQKCLGDYTLDGVYELADALEGNPNTNVYQKESLAKYLKAQVYLKKELYEKARDMYIESFKVSRHDFEAMTYAVIDLINVDQLDYAMDLLDFEQVLYDKNFKYKKDWLELDDNIKGLRELINKKKNEKKDKHNHTSEE